MAAPSNSITTLIATAGVFEDLADLMVSIDPIDALIYKALGVTKATQKVHRFSQRVHRNSAINARLEGDVFAPTAAQIPTEATNTCQIIGDVFEITGTAEATKSVQNWLRVGPETAWRTQDLMKDFETNLLTGVLAAESGATPRQMKGLLNWIISNWYGATDAVLNADGTITGGTARGITLAMIEQAMQDCDTSGGKPTMLYANSFNRAAVSNAITQGRSKQYLLDDKGTVSNRVSVYDSDFGVLKLNNHRNFPTDTVLILDEGYWKRAVLRPMSRFTADPSKSGADGTMVALLQEFTLEARAQQSSARITNLTTSATANPAQG